MTKGTGSPDTVAVSPQALAQAAGFDIPSDSRFIVVEGDGIGEDRQFCKEKLTTLMAVHAYEGGFEDGVELAKRLYEIGGKGHSCGIASTDDAHIDYFARHMPVSRIMVRQPNSKANAGIVHERDADDLVDGMRHVGRQHHVRERLAPSLPEHDVGLAHDRGGPAHPTRSCSATSTTPRSSRRTHPAAAP